MVPLVYGRIHLFNKKLNIYMLPKEAEPDNHYFDSVPLACEPNS